MKYFGQLLLVLLLFTSCEALLFEAENNSLDPYENFDYLWQECQDKYAYFELKQINWDSIRQVYRAELDPGMSQEALFQVMGNMLKELRDDHANLFSNFNTSFFGVELLGQDNFDWRIILDHYLDQEYYLTGPFSHGFIVGEEIGYVRLSRFTGTINDNNLDFILERYQDTKGLILDLRENGGGAIKDVFQLLGRLVEEETLVYYSRSKAGAGPDDFSAPVPVYVTPHSGLRYTKPVILLTDRGTFSSGSLLALAAKGIPQITIIGDATGGGLGLPNGGQLPNGWTYRFSVTQALNLQESPAWENGVPQDISQSIDWQDRTTDEILARAILELQ